MLSRITLLDRDEELAWLRGTLSSTPDGSLTIVEGPAGIGKTQLLMESRRYGQDSGWTVLHAKGMELEKTFAFGVARQLFEPFLLDLDTETQQRCMSGPAAITGQLFRPMPSDAPGAPAAAAGTAEDTTFAMLHGLTWLVINIAHRGPIMLHIDDLQWADDASLRWLVYLLPRIEEVSAAVTVALRQDAIEDSPLIRRIANDAKATVIRPRPLRPTSIAQLLRGILQQDAEIEFVEACHAETSGNPFLVREIASWIRNESITPTAGNVPRLKAIGGLAVSRRIAARLAQLPAGATPVAQALAVLGDGADLHQVTVLSGLTFEESSSAVAALIRADLLTDRIPLAFAHPVVRTAIYNDLVLTDRAAMHAEAAKLLSDRGAEVERIAAHLLASPPGIDFAVRTLRQAARNAVERGAAASAFTYLDRCRDEPMEQSELIELLIEQGSAGQLVDLGASINCLVQAHEMITDPLRKAEVSWLLSGSLGHAFRADDAINVLRRSVAEMPQDLEETDDMRRRSYALELLVATLLPNRQDLLVNFERARALPSRTSIGGRMLDAAIALRDALAAVPGAAERARAALGKNPPRGAEVSVTSPAWHVLIAADSEDASHILDRTIRRLHEGGDLTALATTYAFRALCWVNTGQLAEAEADARQAQQLSETAGVGFIRPFAGAFLAETLVDQGRLDEARLALDWSGVFDEFTPGGPIYYGLCLRARLARLEGDAGRGARFALGCGRSFAAHGGQNPALVPWRSELALCLKITGDLPKARFYADEELELARRWGAPRALGRALRVSAAVGEPAARVRLLKEAVTLLEHSPAKLEYAVSLASLGSALGAAGKRAEGREALRIAMDLCAACGARPMVDTVRSELRAAGGRPRRTVLRGLESLTPSERRVAKMAAEGASNRQIAESLYVTPKTIELHLTSVYRKLDIASRMDLVEALPNAALPA